jgi:hypothetical protein
MITTSWFGLGLLKLAPIVQGFTAGRETTTFKCALVLEEITYRP